MFIKYFNNEIKPKLEAKGLKFFLVRNERIPDLAIYSFSDGERFEPDFLLFIEREGTDKNNNYQVYAEPKGEHLMDGEAWKEKFMLEIADKHKIKSSTLKAVNNYMILGLPFYNDKKISKFEEAVNEFIDKL